ncbi:MAG: dethiobiotin synthase [Deltaproteobacteria bacterium]|nr:dethiobiotin synthase [Deltaproteobacteria bacterium]
MSRGIFIIGTDTDVGKTVVSAGLMYLLLKKKVQAAYFKPVASGEVKVGNAALPADAAFVRAVSGFAERAERVTPFAFADAVAPHLAARLTSRPIEPDVIQNSLDDLKNRYDVIVAEGAGGLAIPLNDEGFMQYDLIRRLNFPCLLVCRAGLGTINHTLLTLHMAKSAGLTVKGIVINCAGESVIEQDNIRMIRRLSGIDAIFTVPPVIGMNSGILQAGNLRDVFLQNINIDDISALMDHV